MSGHNKWSSIKHKKGREDERRGKLFASLGKEITLAARSGGGDPSMNPPLRAAIDTAKNNNMPNDNIDRAIKKGTGELEGGKLEEMSFEGYTPGGIALLVTCISDNRNRSAANIRAYFNKHNGNLGENGAVSWMFQRKARFVIDNQMADEETLLEILMEAEADNADLENNDNGTIEILAAPEEFDKIATALNAAEIPVKESRLTFITDNTMQVTDSALAGKIINMIEEIEEDEDVQEVFSNFELSDEAAAELSETN